MTAKAMPENVASEKVLPGKGASEEIELARAIRTIIFDLDGTIMDTLPDLVTVSNTALAECGYPARTREEILSYVGNGARALMLQAVPPGTSEEDADAALVVWKRVHDEIDGLQTYPYPGVEETIRALRADGVRVGVLSNKYDPGVQKIMNAIMPGFFEVQHGESEDFPRKPDPTGLLKTISELDGQPETTAYVGDSPGDMEVARRAGCMAVAVSWGYHTPEELAPLCDFMLQAPADLLKVTKR